MFGNAQCVSDLFTKVHQIGTGTYGIVYKAKLKDPKQQQQFFALK